MSDDIKHQLRREFKLADGTRCVLVNFGPADLDAIYSLEKTANPFPWSRRNFVDSVANNHICVGVQVDGNWVAQAVFAIASGDAELLLISVSPQWQGRGVGRALLELMSETLEDYAAELFLEVRASNERAIRMYDSCGFNCLGVRPGYYPAKQGREDAHIYGKTLRIG